MRRARGLLSLLLAVLLAGLISPQAIAAGTNSSERAVLVRADGSVKIPLNSDEPSAHAARASVRLAFGLPLQAPARRWLEDDTLPICRTIWEKGGIRYTETVLVTRRTPGDWTNATPPWAEIVVMVQIFGENFTNDYTGAGAALVIDRGDAPLRLELRDDLVFAVSGVPNELVAMLEIPASGIVTTNGLKLEFQANMPPGNAGAMVVKFPLKPPAGEGEIEQLRDLEFDQELQRVKRQWERHGRGVRTPVGFAE